MSVSGRIRLALGITHTTDKNVTIPVEQFPTYRYGVDDGTANTESDLMWRDTLSLTSGGTELDLYDGSLLDAFGQACAFRKINMVVVKNLAPLDTSASDIIIGGAATDEWTALLGAGDTATVKEDGIFIAISQSSFYGYTVASNNKNLKLASSSASLDAEVIIMGTSA